MCDERDQVIIISSQCGRGSEEVRRGHSRVEVCLVILVARKENNRIRSGFLSNISEIIFMI